MCEGGQGRHQTRQPISSLSSTSNACRTPERQPVPMHTAKRCLQHAVSFLCSPGHFHTLLPLSRP